MLWSQSFLYVGFECPFTELTAFHPVQKERKRFDLQKDGASLWDRDVVEAFIGNDPQTAGHYAEFEVAPTNEGLDLMLNLPKKDFDWNSHFRSAVRVDKKAGRWTCEMRIPVKAFESPGPDAGTRWRINLFRCDRKHKAFLAWSPTLTG